MIMLEELKKLKNPGRRKDILFFLCDVIGHRHLSLDDVRTICSHVHGDYILDVDSLIRYSSCFNWIVDDGCVSLSNRFLDYLNQPNQMNDQLVTSTVKALFTSEVFCPSMFSFNADTQRYEFHNELLSLSFSAIRNMLISQEFFEVSDGTHRNTFLIKQPFENLVTELCKERSRLFSLNQLRKQLEDNANAGELAEAFVLSYERRRVSNSILNKKIRIISTIDVGAGYDIVSFNSDSSEKYDRFIEVKAVSKNGGFYWSINEIEVARLRGEQYYLYLVDLSQIRHDKYQPQIIQNPAILITCSTDWLIEPQSFYVRKT